MAAPSEDGGFNLASLIRLVKFQEKHPPPIVGSLASMRSPASFSHSYYANHSLQTGRLCRRFAWF